MKKIISGIVIFSIGFVSGILATKLYMKKQNEEIEEEDEIESEKMPGGEIPENNSMSDEEFEEYYRRTQDEYMRRSINDYSLLRIIMQTTGYIYYWSFHHHSFINIIQHVRGIVLEVTDRSQPQTVYFEGQLRSGRNPPGT